MHDQIIWSPGVTLANIEEQVVKKALAHFHFNKTVTANALGICVRTLHSKLEQYDIEDKKRAKAQEDFKRRNEDFLARSRGLQNGQPSGSGTWLMSDKSDFKTEIKPEAPVQDSTITTTNLKTKRAAKA